MKYPRIKEIVKIYQKENLQKVYEYLSDPNMLVDPSTWSGKIKKTIEEKQFFTAKQMIELIAYKFLFLNTKEYEKRK